MSDVVCYRKPIELRRLGRRHAIVEASAGTGKTYVLEHLVVDLLLRAGATLDQILVVTFTEKATIELTHRVRQKIAALCALRAGDPGTVELGAGGAAGVSDEDCWILDAAARDRLRRALLGFDRANILTIHAFCQRILVENAFLQGRLFDEKTIDEREAFATAFVAALRRDIRPDSDGAILIEAWRRAGLDLDRLERTLFDAQKKLACIYPPRAGAVRPAAAFDAANLVAAAAAWPALAGDAHEQRLRQVFTQNKVHPSTAGARIRRLVGITDEFGRADRDAAALLVAIEQLDREFLAGAKKKSASASASARKNTGGLFRRLAEELAAGPSADALVEQVRQAALALDAAAPPLVSALAHHLLPLVGARLERRKRQEGLFDFQDMLTLVARSLEGDHPRTGQLITALRARYRYALVDEFQDTDETQWQIFRRLFFAAGAPGVLTLVGDPKQAIYSFRGADVHTYLRARQELEQVQDALFLTASYRATPALIAAQNALLEQADPAAFFRRDGRIHYDHPVSCGQPGLALVDAAGAPVPPVVVLDVQRGDAAPAPRLRFWEIKPALLDRIGAEIARLLSDHGRLSLRRPDARRSPIGARDIFVLTRTVRESREVGEALRARRIPFAYFKQERLFETVEAGAVLDLLRALANPGDRSARYRAFITPFFGLTLLDLAACDDLPADHPLMQRLRDWHALGEAGQIDQLFARILDDSGVVSRELFDHGLKGRASERALTNYLHLFELLQRDTAHSPCTLRELAQRLGGYVAGTRRPPDRDGDVQRLETDAEAVQIMTIHQSKGLEASVVFLYGATWPFYGGEVRMFHDEAGQRTIRLGRQPDAEDALFKDEQDDEERRVLYVALTRARARLYLPRYPPKGVCDLRGAYRFVNDRLQALLGGITPDEIRGLFRLEAVSCPRAFAPVVPGGRTLADAIAAWQPPAALLAAPAPDTAFGQAAASRAGFVVTSYSAVRRFHGQFVPAPPITDGVAAADAGADADADAGADGAAKADARPPAAPGELPRGRLSGSFLHEVIEHLPLHTLARAPAFEDWRRLPEVAGLFERMRRRHDRHPAHLEHAQRLVHTALTAPIRLGPVTLPALGGAGRPTREMEFMYPIPAEGHPMFASPAGADGDAPAWRIERGVVKGFVDFLFEHDGRVYVCDWKSDSLPTWDADAVAAHCERHYTVQAELYTLAAVRLLDLAGVEDFERRFGGVLYCFLRGMRAGDLDAGVYFRRPSWGDILGWQRAMCKPGYWGMS